MLMVFKRDGVITVAPPFLMMVTGFVDTFFLSNTTALSEESIKVFQIPGTVVT